MNPAEQHARVFLNVASCGQAFVSCLRTSRTVNTTAEPLMECRARACQGGPCRNNCLVIRVKLLVRPLSGKHNMPIEENICSHLPSVKVSIDAQSTPNIATTSPAATVSTSCLCRCVYGQGGGMRSGCRQARCNKNAINFILRDLVETGLR